MDANDARIIAEQMELTQSRQQWLEHEKNQLKIINATIEHVQTLEQVLDSNEKILANLIRTLQIQAAQLMKREESDKHPITSVRQRIYTN